MNKITTNILIRPESPNDYAAIRSLNDKAFGRSEESDLIKRIRSSNEYIPELSLIAVLEREGLIGYIMFTQVRVGSSKSDKALALAPMSVNPDFQKQGVGSLLIQHGIKTAIALGYDLIVVLGHAQYYPRFGFKPASNWGISCPLDVPEEVFMALELHDGASQSYKGMISYSRAFEL